MLKEIVLAGGSGTRLFPITQGVSKQLLPVYDKPMIYDPLSTLMPAVSRIRNIDQRPSDRQPFERLLGNGHQWRIRPRFAEQQSRRRLAEPSSWSRTLSAADRVAMVLATTCSLSRSLQKSGCGN